MKFKDVKNNISRIANIESPKECQKEVKALDIIVNENPKIKKVNRGNYYDFYIIHYKKHKLSGKQIEATDKKLGRISKAIFKQNLEAIEKYRKNGNSEELIPFLEKQCDKCKNYFPIHEGFEVKETRVFYCSKCFEHIFYHGSGPNAGEWEKKT